MIRAYLDIETTGLNKEINDITVIGFYFEGIGFYQAFGYLIDWDEIKKLLRYIDVLYTFNGISFDLKFIESKTGIDFNNYVMHCDLKNECRKRNLRGGLKRIETDLGIIRKHPEINGYNAIFLWRDFILNGNEESLGKLLDYNSLPKYISPGLKSIIRTATNVDFRKRYKNCAEFLKSLFDYQKKSKDWWEVDDIIYANGKNSQEFRIYKNKKGYILEMRKNGNAWRKDNKHSGKLKDIIEKIK